MLPKLGILALAATLLLAGCTAPAPTNPANPPAASAPLPTEALEAVPMVNHVQFGVFEMDVYVERATEPGKVFRPTPADAASPLTKDAPLFTTARETEHDPTFTKAGPFDKGHALGATLGQWLAARGSAAYLCTGGSAARIDAASAGLVPDGVYTFWNSRLVFTDGPITGGQDTPAGPADGSRNAFTADKDGNARIRVAWEGCNAPSTGGPGIAPTGEATVFAIAYHSDGKTYGPSPGPFGQHTHVQLFGLVRAAKA